MNFSTFNLNKNNALIEPMFLGQSVNLARYDQQRYPIFEKLIETQLSFFWRPEEIDLSKDSIDYNALSSHEQHIFISNLKYQTLLDSIQGRSPNLALLPIVSLPELETWIETWAFSETIHSRSYTHIIRNIVQEPSIVFDDIIEHEQIKKRAISISNHYDKLIDSIQKYQQNKQLSSITLKKDLYLCLLSINVLEAIRFYVSFACSFAFAEQKLMEGNAKIIKLIARDEQLHLNGTQSIINIWQQGQDDPEMLTVMAQCEPEALAIFKEAVVQEKQWAAYLFKEGSMLGLNQHILTQYIEYITDIRLMDLNFKPMFNQKENPIPWIDAWLQSDNVQVAPQEVEISSYLVGQIDNQISLDELQNFKF